MIHDDLEFHNVADLVAVADRPGLRLQRVPEALRPALNELAREAALSPTSAEIRFVAEGPATITLHAPMHHEHVLIHQGEWVVREELIEPGRTRTIELIPSPAVAAMGSARRAFSPALWRLTFSGSGGMHYVGRVGAVRPPLASEKPRFTWLAHGSSITQGCSAQRLANPWAVHAARILAVDLINLGFGGSCWLEPALADHIAERRDWQIATLELGIDLLDKPISDEEFAARAKNFIGRVAGAQPRRPVGVITVFPVSWEAAPPADKRHPEVFRRILRAVLIDLDLPNLRLYEGPELLTDLTGLSADGCHPSAYGHIDIGDAIAQRMRLILPT